MPAAARLHASLLQAIGDTPLVRLRHVGPERGATIWAKCEQLNPGGSIKDRVALALVEAAEREGHLGPGRGRVVEATSGNLGIGLALVCAARGYRLAVAMSEAMSLERRDLLRALGAELHLTPAVDELGGAIARAEALAAEDPAGTFSPRQLENPANPEVHRRTTGPEILAALGDAEIHALVCGVGSGGTITGVGQVLRARHPRCRVIAVEPAASPVLSGGAPGPHRLQGLGVGRVPAVLERGLLDEVRAVGDLAARATRAALARREGLLVGLSSGAAVSVALDVARELGPRATVVTILPDTGERYFSLEPRLA